ncbi:hypothetical protein Ark11_0379 [Candidatus Ichthyocystis hellenicum]|uniref:Uncharacterized protein n=1 Tax=Candidatus Ichthyocystis hellenicum TaxID=1561003 RepID=A0A0S4M1W5_9BURK|nr:hypothetical protein Ark11_0379 [Candidatus Ichthyocystis hellenicum]
MIDVSHVRQQQLEYEQSLSRLMKGWFLVVELLVERIDLQKDRFRFIHLRYVFAQIG